jgi:3-oxoacyl-[acyl-carrier protein] reductase
MSGRVVLITGAAKGVGAAIARHFNQIGYEVVVNFNRSREAAETLIKELSKSGTACSFQADVSQPDQVEKLFDFLMKQCGRLDVLINNASYSSPAGWSTSLDEFPWQEWEKTIQVDVKGTMLCSHKAYPIMLEQRSGKIINFASSAALWGDVPTYLYTAAKSSIVGITRTMSRAFAPHVQVNCIAPGSIKTEWIEKWKLNPAEVDSIAAEAPLKRIGTPEEVAELAAFLASPECTFITGQTIAIDGGILLL